MHCSFAPTQPCSCQPASNFHTYGKLTSFPRAVQAKEDEIVVFSWIAYTSREQRDAVNAKVMADPRLKSEMSNMPFDGKRMIYGGFQMFLEL